MIHVFSLVGLMLATSSCGWVDLRVDKYEKDPEKQFLSEKKFLEAEKARFKHPSGQPQFCVALSGGGIRSAAYSIGVLKGLNLSGKLPEVDIISAVSGGSYAATWFYDQYAQKASAETRGLNRMDRLNEVLSKTSIEGVAGNVKYFNLLQGLVMGSGVIKANEGFLEALVTGDWTAAIMKILPTFFKPNFPPWGEKHMTPSGAAYEGFITNGFQFSGQRRSIQTASDLPYLIVNGTIQASPTPGSSENAKSPEHIRLANNIFEFTSHGMGSPSVGYKSWAELKPEDRADTYTFARVASISGAVVDTSTSNAVLFLGSEAGLGYALLTPTYPDGWIRRFVRLTDGGDSENLGAYGLIKRDCKEILVVDAEYDGEIGTTNQFFYGEEIKGYQNGYQFKAYRHLKQTLDKEGIQLSIKELDQATDLLDRKGKELGANSQTNITAVPRNCWSKEVKVNTERALFDCSKPASEGTVRGPKNNSGLTYVKLSADRKLLDEFESNGKGEAQEHYGRFITGLYTMQKKDGNLDKDFPHYSTIKHTWSLDEFLAVAELGCRAVVRHYTPGLLSPSGEICIAIDRVTTTGTAGKK